MTSNNFASDGRPVRCSFKLGNDMTSEALTRRFQCILATTIATKSKAQALVTVCFLCAS